MGHLSKDRCEPCTGLTPALTAAESDDLRGELAEGWRVDDGKLLRRALRFKNYSAAFATATRVAMLAEVEGHHPEMTVGWGHLEIELSTHAVGGLTRNDFIIAAKIDAFTS